MIRVVLFVTTHHTFSYAAREFFANLSQKHKPCLILNRNCLLMTDTAARTIWLGRCTEGHESKDLCEVVDAEMNEDVCSWGQVYGEKV